MVSASRIGSVSIGEEELGDRRNGQQKKDKCFFFFDSQSQVVPYVGRERVRKEEEVYLNDGGVYSPPEGKGGTEGTGKTKERTRVDLGQKKRGSGGEAPEKKRKRTPGKGKRKKRETNNHNLRREKYIRGGGRGGLLRKGEGDVESEKGNKGKNQTSLKTEESNRRREKP